MSYYIDVGEQDKALAQQIVHDQETLAAIHHTVVRHARPDERAAPGDGRPEASSTGAGRPEGREGLAHSARAEDGDGARQPEGAFAQVARNKAAAAEALAKAAAAQKALQNKIAS